jgi:epimerase EvaD
MKFDRLASDGRDTGAVHLRELAVHGAFEFTPQIFTDDRGVFVSPLQQETFAKAMGQQVFAAAQVSHSRSRRGTVRGIHFTATPPGNAKLVSCPAGKALDFVVDLRRGSPTYRQWDSIALDAQKFRSVYVPPGVGHAFVALAEDTVVSYLFSSAYSPAHEHVLSVFDREVGLPIPADVEVLQSERDRTAPSLEELEKSGLLTWA